MIRLIRRHLSWKLFLSFLTIIVIATTVAVSAAAFAVPAAFERHMSAMASVMGGDSEELRLDLYANFRTAVTEALALAVLVAFLSALILSLFISRQVVLPVREMMDASIRIAGGHYDERVGAAGDAEEEGLDELGRLAQSFNRMAASLEQTEALRSELIGNVAHELRTPLSSIKGYMEGLIDGVLPAEPETFQQVQREAERLQQLVQDLQELSRVEAGALELKLRPTPVSQLVETVSARLIRQFEDKGVTLATDVPPDLPLVQVDEGRIGQVLLNLVGNALQYTPTGGSVSIHAHRRGDAVVLVVEDTGIGIAPEHLPHLFERFYRVDRSRSRAGGGSGIGLTIARHLVRAHGGEIEASSPGRGQGSVFSITLPAG
ncbi:MAG: HAMP domain-containing protein [Anaerolineae bacterium]|nr:HAMP domain-containing protein [Anaerolineae bacterium]